MAASLRRIAPDLAWQRLGPLWPAALAVIVLVLSWPIRTAQPVTVDLSWRVGLQLAVQDGLRFGHDIVFTYGPLGFLARPTPFLGWTSALAFVASGLVYLGLIAALLAAARRLFPASAAVLVTLAVARTLLWIEPFEALQVLAFAVGVLLLRRDHVPRQDLVAVGAGVLAGVAVLGKINVGVFIGAMALAVVLAVSGSRVRGLAVMAVTGAVTFAVLWLATGQQPGDVVAYVRTSLDIVSGYSDAMVRAPARARWIMVAFGFVAVLIAWIAIRASDGWPIGRRLALAALVVLLLFADWKSAFVRNHVAPAFVTLLTATLVLLPRRLPRSRSAMAIAAAGLAFLGVVHPAPQRYADVALSATEFRRQAEDSLMPWRWADATELTRGRLREIFQVPPDIVARLEGRTVHVDPYSSAVVAAYPVFTWRPLPVFQTYSAYTPALDELNADLLRSPDRPERILRYFQDEGMDGQRPISHAVDGRLYWFESPAATLERLCRYREIAASPRWEVLAATGRECGTPVPLGTVTATFGEAVTVPQARSPDDMVVVRIRGIGDGLLAKLRATLWRAATWHIVLDGFRYRLVPGTAPDGLVLSVPAFAQGTGSFVFGPPVRTIEVRGSRFGGDGRLTFEFEAVPVPGP